MPHIVRPPLVVAHTLDTCTMCIDRIARHNAGLAPAQREWTTTGHRFRRLSQSLLDRCMCSEIKLCATFTATSGCCHCMTQRDKTRHSEPRRPARSCLAPAKHCHIDARSLCARRSASADQTPAQLALGGARMNTLNDRLGALLSADLTAPRSRFSSRHAPDSLPLGA